MTKLQRALEAELERLGVREYTWERGGIHHRLCFTVGNRRFVQIVTNASKPHGSAQANALADIRRKVRLAMDGSNAVAGHSVRPVAGDAR